MFSPLDIVNKIDEMCCVEFVRASIPPGYDLYFFFYLRQFEAGTDFGELCGACLGM